MKHPRRLVSGLGAVAAAALTFSIVPALSSAPAPVGSVAAAQECPAGMVLTSKTPGERAFEQGLLDAPFQELVGELNKASAGDAPVCRPAREPEPFAELSAMQAERNVVSAGPLGYTPPGAVRAAVAGKMRALASADSVPGAKGTFRPLGETPLISDGEEFDSVNGNGLADLAGRIDSYAYDAVNQRLFAAPGTGGVYLSTDLGGSWRSVGDALPYQSVGAVTWSPDGADGAGTLLVVSGEASAGGNVYTGMGAFYSTDNGATWLQSEGVPDGLMGFEIEVDPTDPKVVYAATSQGLFRSADAGRTYANVNLPTGVVQGPDGDVDCAGSLGFGTLCQNANWVTDVQIKAPGGVGPDTEGGQVLAAVGYRAGNLPYPGTGTPQSPQNGLYRSDTGEVGSFEFLSDVYGDGITPVGFATQERVGRTEMGAATGPAQNHDFVYAIVEDAVLFKGGVQGIDVPDDTTVTGGAVNNTVLNGIYVSDDFGDSWMRMADDTELQQLGTESALSGYAQTAGLYAPGVQSWYNQWIEPDPTMADASGVPTRLVFGLEEVWESRLSGTPQDGVTQAAEPFSFKVIGPYFSDETCSFLNSGTPYCPTQNTSAGQTTTHPDQQSGIWIPGEDGSVSLVVGNDGGSYVQTVAPGVALNKANWGRGNQDGYHTLLPYDAEVAKDGTVAFGLQDNGSGVITPDGTQYMTFGGDGFFAAIDPDNSQVYYNETTLADMRVTTDGGRTYTSIDPGVGNPMFSNPFVMDPTDANHLLTAGPEVKERLEGPEGDWVQVFDLDEGNAGEPRQMSAVELQGAAAYVGFCSTCDILNKDPDAGQVFSNGLATNVGGDAPPEKGTPSGWHFAAMDGLPNRYITSVEIDPDDAETVYVTLAGYANRQWWPSGSYNDANPDLGEGHVFKSTDAGESFTDITGDLVDVPARWVELNEGQLLVGTDVGVFLSADDQGGAWAALAGLPNAPVMSIRNHPANPDQVIVATFGRGVYSYTFSRRDSVPPPPVGDRDILDACPPDKVPADARQDDDGNIHEPAIDCIIWWEIARGTTLEKYEPGIAVNREQMASFVAQLIEKSGGKLPADPPNAFTDDEGSVHEANINKLAAAGLVRGKSEGRYDPKAPVSRDQMATFIVGAYEHVSDEAIIVEGNYFDDDNGNVHEDNINKSAAAGFTAGRGTGYQPFAVVQRDAMASFLARVLDLLVEEGTTDPKA